MTARVGMVINKEADEVVLTYAGQEVAVTETATSFVNERQKVTVSLEKAIEKNDIFNIGKGDEVKNISFGLFAAEELVSASGTSIPADGRIRSLSAMPVRIPQMLRLQSTTVKRLRTSSFTVRYPARRLPRTAKNSAVRLSDCLRLMKPNLQKKML